MTHRTRTRSRTVVLSVFLTAALGLLGLAGAQTATAAPVICEQ